MQNKSFLRSVTIWGAITTALGITSETLGLGVSATDIGEVSNGVVAAAEAILKVGGLILVIIGRFRASKTISVTGG
jgi:hypothetical protein